MCVIISLYYDIIQGWLVSGHTLERLDVQNDNMTKNKPNNKEYIYIYFDYLNSLLHVNTSCNTTNAILLFGFYCDIVILFGTE